MQNQKVLISDTHPTPQAATINLNQLFDDLKTEKEKEYSHQENSPVMMAVQLGEVKIQSFTNPKENTLGFYAFAVATWASLEVPEWS